MGLRDDFLGTTDREQRARVGSSIANLGKCWATLQDSKREILGRPKAGVLKPERPKPKRKPERDVGPIGPARASSAARFLGPIGPPDKSK